MNEMNCTSQFFNAISKAVEHDMEKFTINPSAWLKHQNIALWFDEIAEQYPDQIAITEVGKGTSEIQTTSITYQELQHASNALANRLSEKGVVSGDAVVVLFKNRILLCTALLAVIKLGGIYVPLDLDIPLNRMEYIVQDCKAEFIITDQPAPKWNIQIETLFFQSIAFDDKISVQRAWGNHDILQTFAYYYTSGSTGKPKGVRIKQIGVLNTISWKIEHYGLSEKDVTLQLLSEGFDAFGANFFVSILTGGKLICVSPDARTDVKLILEIIQGWNVTHMNITPALFYMIFMHFPRGGRTALRTVILGGDTISSNLFQACRDRAPGIRFINEYGPTENSITTTYHELTGDNDGRVIGKPIANTYIFLYPLSNEANPREGEICLCGAGVAAGYINDPCGMDQFIPNPWNPELVIYRTGDLAAQRPDGEFEFIGRLDRQIKRDGYRVDMVEIETALMEISGVENAKVVCLENCLASYDLYAFYQAPASLSETDVGKALSEVLPHYMLPQQILRLEAFPLNSHSKIDIQKMINMLPAALSVDDTIRKVRVSDNISAIWTEVLGHEVRQDINFMDAGGNSFLLLEMFLQIDSLYPNQLTLPDLFSYTTIAAISQYIEEREAMKGDHQNGED